MYSFCRLALLSMLAFAIAMPAAAQARRSTGSDTKGREAFYRCRDANGQTHYGDGMPPACQGVDTEVLDNRGMLLRVIEGEATRSERVKREAAEQLL